MIRSLYLLAMLGFIASVGETQANPSAFKHIIIIIQENRTPDNLFYALCNPISNCSTTPTALQYDIQTGPWSNVTSPAGTTAPTAAPLYVPYDLNHSHGGFIGMCRPNSSKTACQMGGVATVPCTPVDICPANAQFSYVDDSTGTIDPYLNLAANYGWANYMFQTNQGPSFPAHQFLFGATSAPSAADDHVGTFASENTTTTDGVPPTGCIASSTQRAQLINSKGVESSTNRVYPCFEHKTLADLLSAKGLSWRYYAPNAGGLWTAPAAIAHLCVSNGTSCTGSAWVNNVDLVPSDILTDIQNCNLRSVSWVAPTAQNSDHAEIDTGDGPSWVASVVNAIGTSKCPQHYWSTTAIIVTWDDWGGWYDHEPPQILPSPQGGYQYGFRVPLLFVSAWTPLGTISNVRYDFGSVVNFVEHNFLLGEGKLTFSDARSTSDLREFYRFTVARWFTPIPAAHGASFFIHQKDQNKDPDDE